ncbi:MAG: hypothetical protein ACK445_13070, partial [Bacteroidota bacterium]
YHPDYSSGPPPQRLLLFCLGVSTIPIIHRDHHRSGYYFFALACLPSRLFIGTTTAAAFIMVSERRALTLF